MWVEAYSGSDKGKIMQLTTIHHAKVRHYTENSPFLVSFHHFLRELLADIATEINKCLMDLISKMTSYIMQGFVMEV